MAGYILFVPNYIFEGVVVVIRQLMLSLSSGYRLLDLLSVARNFIIAV